MLEQGPEVWSGRQLNMRLERDLKEQFGEKVSEQVHFISFSLSHSPLTLLLLFFWTFTFTFALSN